MLSGAENSEQSVYIQKEVVIILHAKGLSWAKWHSNHLNLLQNDEQENSLEMDETSTSKALKVTWSPKADTVKFKIDRSLLDIKATKRNILSV